ncbi:Hypothetical predicted protein [Octopus vulgaris]|uniref:DUF7041 domain-containing protein n=1 Tax=Octopus vulgaris TaxID=6645 RepID=A0AA36F8Z1_OCTVU|nr:Hypothetical predicted protein [Octopus vulgaris]
MSLASLPIFTGDATLWFAQLEAYFCAHSVSSEQQLQILCSCMPPQLATTARYLITDPSPDATYASVKLEVEKRNTRSEESRFNELMADEELGDRTPSEFLRHLRELSDIEPSDQLLGGVFTLFLQFSSNKAAREPEISFCTIPFHPNGKHYKKIEVPTIKSENCLDKSKKEVDNKSYYTSAKISFEKYHLDWSNLATCKITYKK